GDFPESVIDGRTNPEISNHRAKPGMRSNVEQLRIETSTAMDSCATQLVPNIIDNALLGEGIYGYKSEEKKGKNRGENNEFWLHRRPPQVVRLLFRTLVGRLHFQV